MSESERIINSGLFPPSFFEDEIRCGYEVTSEKKKLWALQIDMYLELARICEKHGLRYFAMFGTALGAVRHNGFIPWDDDIDVVMPRADYDRLCSEFASEFKAPYFLQTPDTDSGYYYSFAKLRNSNTAQISMPFKNALFNQGFLLDIFPLDYCDPSKATELREEILPHIMRCSSYMKRGSESMLNEKQLENMKKYHTDEPMQEYRKIQELSQSCMVKDYVGIPSLAVYQPEKMIWPSSCFEDVEFHAFESIKVALPSQWDKVLTICYGNYMQFPPLEQRGAWHKSCVIDSDHSYKEYLTADGWCETLIEE